MALIRCREGEYAKNRIPVTGSVYGIPERMKELRESLFIMFNTKTAQANTSIQSKGLCKMKTEIGSKMEN